MVAVAPPLAGLGAWGLQFLAVWMLGLVLGWLVSRTRHACVCEDVQAVILLNSMTAVGLLGSCAARSQAQHFSV